MKAFEIIKRLTSGWIDLEQAGAVCLHEELNHVDYFGTERYKWNGYLIRQAEYFYLYIPAGDEVRTYRIMGELPNAYCKRTGIGDIVALWRIE